MKRFKIVTAIVLSFLFVQAFGQNNFSNGFGKGFKEGFCYSRSFGCMPPMTPMTPLTRLGESNTSYQDGYNRGFQVGLDLQRLQSGVNTSTYSSPDFYRSIPLYISSEYIPPVDLQQLANALERKQRLFDSRAQWTQNRIDKIADMAVVLIQKYATDNYNRITASFSKFIEQLNSQPLDYTDNSLFSQIISAMKQYESQIYSAYTKAFSEINSVTIPTNFTKTYTNGICQVKNTPSNALSYSVVDNNGKKLTNNEYEAFNLKTQVSEVIPSVKIYYLFSKTDKNYYSITEDKVMNVSSGNVLQKMKFLFSSDAFFMLANFQGSIWIFDKGVSKTNVAINLGDKVLKTADGKMDVFRIYQDKLSLKKHYIPKHFFTDGSVNEEYPIFTN